MMMMMMMIIKYYFRMEKKTLFGYNLNISRQKNITDMQSHLLTCNKYILKCKYTDLFLSSIHVIKQFFIQFQVSEVSEQTAVRRALK